jgi:hypothetical protein
VADASPGGSPTLSDYTTVSVIGKGATGEVRLMRHQATGALVAVKLLAPALVGDPGFRERFRGEAAILRRLRHPHIAALLWFVEAGETVAIGMELVDGVELRGLIGEGIAEPEAALVVLRGSLGALDHAHGAGVVHRDYKPANVLVDGEGRSRLVDFGIAAGAGEAGVVEGTPAYTAPEQWHGGPATPSTDVYACAAVLHECVTGRVPFAAPDLAALRAMHESAPVPLDGVPEPLHPLLLRGLAKTPADRYPSAGAFLEDLERIASTGYGPAWAQRGVRALGVLALGSAALFPLHGVAAAGPSGAPPPGTPPPGAPPSSAPAGPPRSAALRTLASSRWGIGGAVAAAVALVIGGVALARGSGSTSATTAVAAALSRDFGDAAPAAAEGGPPGSAGLDSASLVVRPDGRVQETVVLRGPGAVTYGFAFCDAFVCGNSDNIDCVGNLYIPNFGGAYLTDAQVPPPPGSHATAVMVLAGGDAGALAPAALVSGGSSSSVDSHVLAAAPQVSGNGVSLSFVSPIAPEIRQHIRNGMLCGFTAEQRTAFIAAHGPQQHNDSTAEVRVVIDWSPPSAPLSGQTQAVLVNGVKNNVALQPAAKPPQGAGAFTPALQGDARWASTAAGTRTYGVSGTVPATLSTLFSGFGIHRDPPAIGKELIAAGAWSPGKGVDWRALQGYITAQHLTVGEVDVFQALGAMHAGAAVMVAYADHRLAPAQEVTAVITDYDSGTDTFGVIDPVAGQARIAWNDLLGGDPWLLAVSRPAAAS